MNVLGAVAKGLGDAVLGSGSGDEVSDAVENLLERIATVFLPEDRVLAIAELKELVDKNAKAKEALGAIGFQVLREAINDDRGDVEVLRGILEILHVAIRSGDEDESESAARRKAENPSAQESILAQVGESNSAIFAGDEHNVSLLLGLLEEVGDNDACGDFYVRYGILRIFNTLIAFKSSTPILQAALLASPMAISAIIGAFFTDDANEILRNETILLLRGLAEGNAEIQKMAVFEGVFDHTFQVVDKVLQEEEGDEDGSRIGTSIVLQDCLELLGILVAGNSSNQLMFRESGFLSKTLATVKKIIQPSKGKSKVLQASAERSVSLALGIVVLLTKPPSSTESDSKAARVTLTSQGFIESLVEMLTTITSPSAPSLVATQALRCLCAMIEGSEENKNRLSDLMTARENGGSHHRHQHHQFHANQEVSVIPALHRVLLRSLYSESVAESTAGCEVIRAFCQGNSEGQSALASTIFFEEPSVGGTAEMLTFGGDLLKALVGRGSVGLTSVRAAIVTCILLTENESAKARVTKVSVPARFGVGESDLLACIARLLADSKNENSQTSALTQLAMVRLLVALMTDNPSAAQLFLASPSYVPLAVDLVGSKNRHVAGMASVLLGLCVLSSGKVDSTVAFNQRSIIDVLSKHVGLHKFFCAWDDMMTSPEFQMGLKSSHKKLEVITKECLGADQSLSTDAAYLALIYDYLFAGHVKDLQPSVRQSIVSSYSGSLGDGESKGAPASLGNGNDREQISKLQEEIRQLRTRNESLATDLLAMSNSKPEQNGQAAAIEAKADIAAREFEKKLAEGHSALKASEKHAQSLQDKIKELENTLAQSEEQSRKHEADLKDLSDAYNTLDEHSHSLESQLSDAKDQLERAGTDAAASLSPSPQSTVATAAAIAAAEGTISKLKQELEVAKNDSQKHKEAVDISQSVITKLKEEFEAAQRDNEKLSESGSASHSELTKLKSDLGILQRENEKLKANLESEVDEVNMSQSVIAKLQEELEATKVEHDKLKAKLESECEENDESMNDLLVCLGQEEKKTNILVEKLGQYMDAEAVEALLEDVGED